MLIGGRILWTGGGVSLISTLIGGGVSLIRGGVSLIGGGVSLIDILIGGGVSLIDGVSLIVPVFL